MYSSGWVMDILSVVELASQWSGQGH
jgi:hypothetical protein